jgi:cell division protein FtsB
MGLVARFARALFLVALLCGNLVLIYSLLWSEHGLFAYLNLKERHTELSRKVDVAESSNVALSREIIWLREDRRYLEKIIRTQMNYLKGDEVLYIFREQEPETSGDQP